MTTKKRRLALVPSVELTEPKREMNLLRKLIQAAIDLAEYRLEMLGLTKTTSSVAAMCIATFSSTSLTSATGQIEREIMYRAIGLGLQDRGYVLDEILKGLATAAVETAQAQKELDEQVIQEKKEKESV